MLSPARIITVSALLLFCHACKSKKKEAEKQFISAVALIQNQVSHVDTSLYSIRKFVRVDSIRTDTIYFPREEFREAARDFLSIPDISTPAFKSRYTETTQFDETINRAMVIYIPVNPDQEIVQRQEILLEPNDEGGRITSIIISTVSNSKDSSVQKSLLWTIDKSFQVATLKQLPGQPEKYSTTKVVWNEEQEF